MKNLKIILMILLVFILTIYLAILVVVPNLVNLNKYKPDVQKIVTENAKFKIDFDKLHYSITWNLGVKVSADKVDLAYLNDNKEVATVDKLSATVPLYPLIFKTFMISNVELDNVKLDMHVLEDGHFYIEKYIKENFTSTEDKESQVELPIKISNDMPIILVKGYEINIKDDNINQNTKIKGNEIKVDDFSLEKHIRISADGKLVSNNEEYVVYDIRVASFLPENNPTTKDENINLSLTNPFKNIIKHKFKTKINADLKITNNDEIAINGDLNVDKLTFKSAGVILPQSYLYLSFKDNNVKINSDFYTAKNEKTTILGNVKYGKRANIDLAVKNQSVKISNIKSVVSVILDVLNIDNELNLLDVQGYISSDFSVKTNLKKIESQGNLLVKNCAIKHKKLPISIDNVKATLNFANNKILINDTSASVSGAKLEIVGEIDNKANSDIKITSEKLPIAKFYQIFALPSVKKQYNVTSGVLTLNAYIKGQLAKLTPSANMNLSNLAVKDNSLNGYYSIQNIKGDLVSKDDKYSGLVNVANIKAIFPSYNVHLTAPNAKINIDENDIIINKFNLNLDNSKLTFEGKVKNYLSKLDFKGNLNGQLNSNSLKSYLPADISTTTKASGNLPMMATIKSDGNVTDINAQIGANSQHYFSPIEINEMKYKTSVFNFDGKLSGNDFLINDVGLYSISPNATLSDNFKKNISNSSKVLYAQGKINNLSNPNFDNFKLNTAKNVTISIPTLPNSSATFNANIDVAGSVNNPQLIGKLNFKNISIPSFDFKANDFIVNLAKDTISGNCSNLMLNNSYMTLSFNMNNNFVNPVVNSLNISAHNFDLDKFLTALNNLPQNSYAPSASVSVQINNGYMRINKFLMGNVEASNMTSNFTLKNNVINFSNLRANAYQGTLSGTLSYNVPYLMLKANLTGNNINADQASGAFLGIKHQLQGNMNAKVNVSMVCGTPTQQARTLKGTANIDIQNGEMGNLGKFEYYLYARNILASKIINLTLNSILKTVTPKNTGHFAYLKGDLKFNNGYLYISPITTSGQNMSLYLSGNYNLLNNLANVEILGRISKDVNDSLGALGEVSISKILGNTKVGAFTAGLFQSLNLQISQASLNKIPQLTPSTSNSNAFQVIIYGDITKPTAVNSFKWVTTQDVTKASQNLGVSVPKSMQGVATQIQQAASSIKSNMQQNTYIPAGSKPSGYATSQSTPKNIEVPDFIKNLPDTFKD